MSAQVTEEEMDAAGVGCLTYVKHFVTARVTPSGCNARLLTAFGEHVAFSPASLSSSAYNTIKQWSAAIPFLLVQPIYLTVLPSALP